MSHDLTRLDEALAKAGITRLGARRPEQRATAINLSGRRPRRGAVMSEVHVPVFRASIKCPSLVTTARP